MNDDRKLITNHPPVESDPHVGADSGGAGVAARIVSLEQRMRGLAQSADEGCEQIGLRAKRFNFDSRAGWWDFRMELSSRRLTPRWSTELIDQLESAAAAWLYAYHELTFLTYTRPVWNS